MKSGRQLRSVNIRHEKSDDIDSVEEILNRNYKLESAINLMESSSGPSDSWDIYLDQRGELVHITSSFNHLTGHFREDFISGRRKIEDILYHEDLNKFHEVKELFSVRNKLQDTSVRIVDPENQQRIFSMSDFPVMNSDNTIAGSRLRFTKEESEIGTGENLLYGESLLRLILNHTDQGIILVDSEGKIVGWNKCIETAMGIPKEKVVNQKVWKIQYNLATDEIKKNLKEEDLKKIWEERIFNMSNGELLSGYGSVLNASGEVEYLHDMIRPIVIDGKKYFCSFHTYLTGNKKVEDELRQKIEELAAANRELELFTYTNNELKQFAYTASHQLQEPARTINNFMKIIEEDYSPVLDENLSKYINVVRSAAERMSFLINTLLDYSRIGRKSVLTKADCNEIMKEVLSDLGYLISDSGANITCGELPILEIYEKEFHQLMVNLISNAVKFRNKTERPVVRIEAEEHNGEYRFSVSDNGIGIDPSHFDRIFDIFQRLHFNEDKYEGKGVGLSYCRKIVNMHNGKIWVESNPGEGSVFFFTIPASR